MHVKFTQKLGKTTYLDHSLWNLNYIIISEPFVHVKRNYCAFFMLTLLSHFKSNYTVDTVNVYK